MLWLAGITLSVLTVIQLATFEEAADSMEPEMVRAFGRDNIALIDSLEWLQILSLVVGTILAVAAAWRWRDVRLSRRLARWGFLIVFVTPFAIMALPLTSMMDFSHLNEAARQQLTGYFGMIFGLSVFLTVGPKAIALFPAIIRGSMTLKTLLPESATPGWAAAVLAPFYAIFLLLVVGMINQISGNFFLLAGVGCLMVAPLVYLKRAKEVLRPHTPEEAAVFVRGARRQVLFFNLTGGVLLVIFIIDLGFLDFGDALEFAIGIAGNVLLLTVVAADLILALLRAGYEQTKAFHGTGLHRSLDEKFAALAGTGLTDVRTGPLGDSGDG